MTLCLSLEPRPGFQTMDHGFMTRISHSPRRRLYEPEAHLVQGDGPALPVFAPGLSWPQKFLGSMSAPIVLSQIKWFENQPRAGCRHRQIKTETRVSLRQVCVKSYNSRCMIGCQTITAVAPGSDPCKLFAYRVNNAKDAYFHCLGHPFHTQNEGLKQQPVHEGYMQFQRNSPRCCGICP